MTFGGSICLNRLAGAGDMRQMRMPQHNLNLTVGAFSAGVTLGSALRTL